MVNRGDMVTFDMVLPLFLCACAIRKDHAVGHHCTMYSVVLLGLCCVYGVLKGTFV